VSEWVAVARIETQDTALRAHRGCGPRRRGPGRAGESDRRLDCGRDSTRQDQRRPVCQWRPTQGLRSWMSKTARPVSASSDGGTRLSDR